MSYVNRRTGDTTRNEECAEADVHLSSSPAHVSSSQELSEELTASVRLYPTVGRPEVRLQQQQSVNVLVNNLVSYSFRRTNITMYLSSPCDKAPFYSTMSYTSPHGVIKPTNSIGHC